MATDAGITDSLSPSAPGSVRAGHGVFTAGVRGSGCDTGNDAVAVWKQVGSLMNLGHANLLRRIKPGIYRWLTSCGWGVDAPLCAVRDEQPLG